MFLVFFVAVHLIGMALIAAIQPFGQDAAQRNIQHQTGCNAKHDFEHQQQAQLVPQGRLRRQQGDGFIRCCQEHSQQRAGGNDPAGIKVGRYRRKPALWYAAQQCAGHKAPVAAASQRFFNSLAMVAFQPFDQQICQIQKRQHFYAVDQCIQKSINNNFHNSPICCKGWGCRA